MKIGAINILLVEDNPGDARLIKEILKDGDLVEERFFLVENLAMALVEIQTHAYDIILLDLNLPDAKNLEALDRVIEVSNNKIPVIVITGLDDEDVGIAAIDCGADDYLLKGEITLVQLSRSIRYAIKRKKMMQLVKLERDRSQIYLDTVNTIIVALDNEGKITTINRKGCRILGYEETELIGCFWFSSCLPQPQGMEEMYPFFQKIIAGNLAMEYFENPITTSSGEVRHVAWHNSLLQDGQGKIIGTLSAGDDITERRQAEEENVKLQAQLLQAQKMESVGRLAGGVAHDYNNMLNVILGNAEMALAKLDPLDPMCEDLREIYEAGVRSTDLTRQLLAFARKQTIAPVALDLNEAVKGMLKMLHRLIGEDIDLVWLPKTSIWPVMMDPSQVDQLLANLCVNARDAIDGVGRVTLETEQATFDDAYCADHPGYMPGEYVLLAVSDDGCGMDRDTLAKIFEPFFTTKAVGRGTGLGLSTVYGIVKQNNGFINVYSEPGKGTTFKIYLAHHTNEKVKVYSDSPASIPTGHGEIILVVDDEASILKLAKKILEELGYTVLTAERPNQALRLAEEHPNEIDLLITDVVMPDMNGKDLSNRLHEVCPKLKTLFMSGYTVDGIAHRGILDKDFHFIQKPFSKVKMAIKIKEAMSI